MTGGRWLIVEDDPDDVAIMSRALTAASGDWVHETVVARTLVEVDEIAAQDVEFCVVLVDVHIPDGRGPVVVEHVTGRWPSAAVVVLTGLADGSTAPYFEAGAHAYLPKSELTPESLGRTIETAETIRAIRSELEGSLEAQYRLTAELEDVLGIVAHDLRAPLRTARLFADRVVHDRDRSRTWLNRLDDSLARMDAMIHAVLTYARLTHSPPQPEIVDFEQLMLDIHHDLLADVSEAAGAVSWAGSAKLWCSRANAAQIVQNLLLNSLQYAGEGRPPVILVEAVERGETVEIRVVDNGEGIEEQYREQAFRPFERLTSEGDGLGVGLATCDRLATMNGGSIDIESSTSDGTTVRLTLPAPPTADAGEPALSLPPWLARPMRAPAA